MDLEYLKNINKIVIGVTITMIMTGCMNNRVEKDTKPQWIYDMKANQISACVKIKNQNVKMLKKIALAKAKATYSMDQQISINTISDKKESTFNKKSIQSSHSSFNLNDFKIMDQYKNKKEYCLLLEFSN